jgi:amino acid adenylation domain-containing protein/non-ribosomal peptide synthase protein (TIGR01720 family)
MSGSTRLTLQQTISQWNKTDVPFSSKTYHELFEQQVHTTPDNSALFFNNQTLTYRQLNERANQLAHTIRQRHLKKTQSELQPGTLVAIFLERSMDMIVAMLGVMKAGAAYIPMDPAYPEDRIRYMLDHSKTELIISQKTLLDQNTFLDEKSYELICMDSDQEDIADAPTDNLSNIVTAHDLAYIIYTSGSTGKPKGIMLEHYGLVNLAVDHKMRLAETEHSRVMQYISFSFDASLAEIAPALITGAALYIVPTELRIAPDKIYEFLDEHRITHAVFPAAMFELLPKKKGLAVEVFLVGGDICQLDTFAFWQQDHRVINAYGPSETTVCSTTQEYSKGILSGQIGKPIHNVTHYVLSDTMQAVAIGKPGELYIGGEGVARGYLHRPDLTKEHFLPNPFCSDEEKAAGRNIRIYRTGDQVKWLPDGSLQFLGRVDFQVKIRGFRIEPEEIEAVLAHHSTVQKAVVIPLKDSHNQTYLAGYILPESSAEENNHDTLKDTLRLYLGKQLPDYMVPTALILLESFTLTPNGKIDRKALPEPQSADFVQAANYVAPETEIEKQLAAIWCDVLNLERVGIHDIFFAIGGQSLNAALVVSRINDNFSLQCPVSTIFEYPDIQRLAEHIAEQQASEPISAIPSAIDPVSRDNDLPLSFAQQRLWFMDQYEQQQNVAYNEPMAFRLHGKLDVSNLQQAFDNLIIRHESLRTIFVDEGGVPLQKVLAPYHLEIQSENLNEQDLDTALSQEVAKPFILNTGPLLRVRLFELAGDDHVLLINQHHIICDGWSAWILLNELNEEYAAVQENRAPQLQEMRVQYADYASWQRKWMQGDFLDKQIDYWKDKLANFETLDLSTDNPRPAVQTYNGKHYYFSINRETATRLKQLSLSTQSSLFMVLLASFDVLLRRYTGQEEIIVGSPIANRNNQLIEQTIGFFVNTLALSNTLGDNPPFTTLLERVKRTCLDAYAHQDVPFEQVVDALQVKRDASRTPIFDVMFVLQNAGDELGISFPEISAEQLEFDYESSRFDLQFSLTETDEGFTCEVEYNTDLFLDKTIHHMAEHFDVLLTAIAENPGERIDNYPLMNSAEKTQVLTGWNQTDVAFHVDMTVQQLFEAQVLRTPDLPAAMVEEEILTFQQLNKKVNQLAHTLRDVFLQHTGRELAPDTIIGLCLERSFDMLISIHGIMKAGGAYVPLDPDYPEERLQYMLADAKVDIILTHGNIHNERPFLDENNRLVLDLDTMQETLSQADSSNPSLINTPQDLAYIIYTSGSTGNPKGVMLQHQGAVNRISWMQNEYQISAASFDRVLQKTPYSFDVSVWEFIWPMITGCPLCFAKPGGHKDPEYLIEIIKKYAITTLHFVPSMLKAFVDALELRDIYLPTVKRVICSGEALPTQLALDCQKRIPGAVHNLYGPTEASIDVSSWDCSEDEHRDNPGIPIGRPIDNIRLYVLDDQLHPVPIGIPGELYISGVGLARGYLNRPDLTTEIFGSNPFYRDDEPDWYKRLYKTGDLVRWLPDGAIDYIGRTDFQVKLRGFRIELGEIDSLLSTFEGVNQCVVIVKEHDGEKRLIAYYVLTNDVDDISLEEVRHFLGKNLPEYMVPSLYVAMDTIPLTPSGKVNRKALPEPTIKDLHVETAYVEPQTEIECKLHDIYSEVLHLEHIGIHDNFFRLGGHSLTATQVAARVQFSFEIACPVKVVFECPDIKQISIYVEEQLAHGVLQSHPLSRVDRDQALPLSYPQQQLWFLDQYEDTYLPTYNIPLAFRLRGDLDIQALETAINILLARHESLRTLFPGSRGTPYQEIRPVQTVEIRPETIIADSLSSILSEEAGFQFDLAQGPLIRFRLFSMEQEDHVLMINQHHIISDGWSLGVLLEELSECYAASHAGETPRLPEIEFDYADYASWQRQWMTGDVYETQLKYWNEHLDNFTTLDLPTDHSRPIMRSTRGDHFQFSIDRETTDSLKNLSRETDTTLFMLLLSMCNVLLSRYSGKDDVLIGTPVANRNQQGLDRILGYFVNTLPMRIDISGNPGFKELLTRVKKTCFAAYSHQDLPFEQIVEELQIERDTSHTPIFDVMFSMEYEDSDLSFPGIEIEDLSIDYNIAKFDLTFTFAEKKEHIDAIIEYNTDLYDTTTIARMAGHINMLLEGITSDPDQKVNLLPLLPDDEKQQILMDWNTTRTAYPNDVSVQQVFEEQAARTPDKPAVSFGKEVLSYKELNEQANQLANSLRNYYRALHDKELQPDTLVGLCLNRGVKLIVGILGILKAGCAYVPLDPSYPESRLKFMMEDAHAPLVLSQQSLIERLLFLSHEEYDLVSLDGGWDSISKSSKENPVHINTARDLAYVIYTSGSTGKPKGTTIEHRSICRLVKNTNFIHFSPEDNVAHVANISFDAATLEVWGALLNGAHLICVEQDVLLNAEQFAEFLEKEKISYLLLTTQLFHLYANLKPSMFCNIKNMLSGGDALVPEAVYQVLECPEGHPKHLINAYGPTENTTITTTFELTKRLPKGQTIPVGRPIANTTCYILDSNLNPVPIGVPGELYTGGDGVAREYLRRPEITVKSFVHNPFCTEDEHSRDWNTRLYRTGDMVRWLADGQIEFLGRLDSQVKIRGFRIELEEIDARLASYETVNECVVIARSDNEQKYLAAYFVPKDDEIIDTDALRHFLREELPEYMIPSFFIELRSMPMTSHHKIDRRALPAPETQHLSSDTHYAAPETEIEKILAEIWKDVLKLDRVGINDNFFSSGGDSIMSIQVISRSREQGLILSPRQLFANPTIAELAAVATRDTSKVTANQGLVKGSAALIPVQEWFLNLQLKQPEHFNQAFLITLNTPITADQVSSIFHKLIKQHDALRLRFTKESGKWGQNFSEEESVFSVACTVIDLTAETDADSCISRENSKLQETLDFGQGPVIALALYNGHPDGSQRLFMAIHHLLIDMVSWRILFEDFQTCFEQLCQQKPLQLPQKSSSFADWGEALARYGSSDILLAQRSYWEDITGTQQSLFVDMEAAPVLVSEMQECTVALGQELTETLLRTAPDAYHTQVNDLLLTALVMAYAKWTGETTLQLILEGHGREDIDTETDISRTMGWFTSIFPVRLDLPAEYSAAENHIATAIKTIKEQLHSIPDKGIGYGILNAQEAFGRDTTSEQQSIAFNYLGRIDSEANQAETLFGPMEENVGASNSPHNQALHLIEINGAVLDNDLQMTFSYSSKHYHDSTIPDFAAYWQEAVGQIVSHCANPENRGYTPTDFPLVDLNQEQVDDLTKYFEVATIYPASPLQSGLLFHALYEPDTDQYCTQLFWSYEGVLDTRALYQSWEVLVDRYPILRTAFVWEGMDHALQVVAEHIDLPWQELDWRTLSAKEQKRKLHDYLDTDRSRGFDFAQPGIMRLHLIRLQDRKYEVIWTHHHVLLDGWSVSILMSELRDIYEACSTHTHIAQTQPAPFEKYIAWMQEQDHDKTLTFWKDRFGDFEAPTAIHINSHALDIHKTLDNNQQKHLHFSNSFTSKCQAFAQQNQVTLNALLKMAWFTVLSQYGRNPDVTIGATVSGRPGDLPKVESMVGLFINTLPFRVHLDDEKTALEQLQELHDSISETNQYGDMNLSEVKALTSLPSDVPLFYSLYVFENYPLEESSMDFENLKICDMGSFEKTNFPLTIVITPGDKLDVMALYDGDCFPQENIARMLGHIEHVVAWIMDHPELPLSRATLLKEDELQQMLSGWEQAETPFPADKTVVQLFEEQVCRTPNAVAVTIDQTTVSYEQLNRRVNRLAHSILEQMSLAETSPENTNIPIGLCAKRSLDSVVAMIAILKAGGAYVPLDADYPEERLRFMLEDTGITIVVAQQEMSRKNPFLAEDARQVILVDDESALTDTETNPEISANARDLAYIIYTSGSTGTPKGVMIEQLAITRLALQQSYLSIDSSDCIAHASNISFDAATFEIWASLLNGARMSIIAKETLLSPPLLKKALMQTGVNIEFFTTALFHILVEEEPAMFSNFKAVLFGGEEANAEIIRTFLKQRNDTMSLVNIYGPTEATSFTTYCVLGKEHAQRTSIPIGKALQGRTLYVLDPNMNPVPSGVPGELYIGGEAALARGYLNRPERTQESFIANPFATDSHTSNMRLYKTGDLVRQDESGNLEFVGRTDFQVKIRGFRIELGEIESRLHGFASISNALVLTDTINGQKEVIAYMVPAKKQQISIADIRNTLSQDMPSYMIPAAFVVLDKFPLTPNGKIDRKALPEPQLQSITESYTAPQTETEKTIAAIWQDVLKTDRIGVHDNFFNKGGHSLTATQVISRIQRVFDLAIPVKAIFDHPTITALAVYIHKELSGHTLRQEIIASVDRSQPLPLSFSQERLWFLDQYDAKSAYNIPVAYRIKGALDVSILGHCFTLMIERHESFRTTFKSVDGQPFQVIQDPWKMEITVEDINEEHLADILFKENLFPFDLAEGPLFRVRLFKLSDEEYVLSINQHHIISDGWSLGLFYAELDSLYRSFVSGETPIQASQQQTTLHYADFASWQRKWLQGNFLEQEVESWRKKLAGCQYLELPTTYSRPQQQSYNGDRTVVYLDSEITTSLNELAGKTDATLFMVLLTVFNIMLQKYSGQSDIVVGSPIANRNHPDIETLFGFFVNTIALRNDLSGDPTVIELIEGVKKTCLEAYAHQDIQFEHLLEVLDVKRDTGRSPIFNVMFILQNASTDIDLKLDALTITPVELQYNMAKFDLTFNMIEIEGRLGLEVEYNTDLYDLDTVQHLMRHFEQLLRAAVETPNRSIHALSMLEDTEREQLLSQWNSTEKPFPEEQTIIELFEEQVLKTPDNTALVFKEKQMSYGELNQKSNQLAHAIRDHFSRTTGRDITTDTLIGLCVDRGINIVVGMLAIIKAGGAYVPLDPAYPEERLKFMMEDAETPLILTEQEIVRQIPALQQGDLSTTLLDSEWESIAEHSGDNPTHINSPSDLIYVIYTSGSTGKPKGVLVEHRGIVNLQASEKEMRNLDSQSHVLQFASMNFDAATVDIYPALLEGAALHIAEDAIRKDPVLLFEYMKKHKISIACLTPAFLATMPRQPLPDLRNLVVAGDVCDTATIDFWAQGRTLCNGYGPTEASVCATFCVYKEGMSSRDIGSAIQNCKLYILDEHQDLVPMGVSGELYIGGVGVTRGYLHRHELTEERFIANPFATDTDKQQGRNLRLYKTGDLVRWLHHGHIEFMGRTDFQVKISGFRVEPAEIESRLASYTEIKECLVMARDVQGDKRLFAYFVAEQQDIQHDTLHAFLAEHMPEYMIPSTFIQLESFPLSPSGKIDRQALDKYSVEEVTPQNFLDQARDPMELKLTQIWNTLLGTLHISINQDFFDSGGYSLLMIKLIAEINKTFDLSCSVAWGFSNNTIKKQADAIRSDVSVSTFYKPVVPFNTTGDNPPLFFIHPGGAGAVAYNEFASLLDPRRQAFYGIEAYNLYSGEPVLATFQEIAARYIEYLRTILPDGPCLLGGWSLGGLLAFEMAQQMALQGQEIAKVYMIDTFLPGDTEKALIKKFDEAEVMKDLIGHDEYFKQLPQDFLLHLQEVNHLENLASMDYQPHSYGGTVQLFKATEELDILPGISTESSDIITALSKTYVAKKDNNWASVVDNLEIIPVAANHQSMMQSKTLKSIADSIQQDINNLDIS